MAYNKRSNENIYMYRSTFYETIKKKRVSYSIDEICYNDNLFFKIWRNIYLNRIIRGYAFFRIKYLTNENIKDVLNFKEFIEEIRIVGNGKLDNFNYDFSVFNNLKCLEIICISKDIFTSSFDIYKLPKSIQVLYVDSINNVYLRFPHKLDVPFIIFGSFQNIYLDKNINAESIAFDGDINKVFISCKINFIFYDKNKKIKFYTEEDDYPYYSISKKKTISFVRNKVSPKKSIQNLNKL